MKIYMSRYSKDGTSRKIDVRIDKWDTWSLDNTLAHIIAPALIKLKEQKYGSPLIEDGDVPDDLKSTSAPSVIHTIDDNWHSRWDWVLDEMIWTFEELRKDDGDSQFYDIKDNSDITNLNHSYKIDHEGLEAWSKRINNGTRLFGKYYTNLWD